MKKNQEMEKKEAGALIGLILQAAQIGISVEYLKKLIRLQKRLQELQANKAKIGATSASAPLHYLGEKK